MSRARPECITFPFEAPGTLMPLGATAVSLFTQTETIAWALDANREGIDELAACFVGGGLRSILAAGSGDSLRVAETVGDAVIHNGRVPVRVMNALSYATEGDMLGDEHTLAMVISSTGRVGDATDMLQKMRRDNGSPARRSGLVAVMTDAPEDSSFSQLYRREFVLRPDARLTFPVLPTRTTTAGQALAMDLGLAIGHARGLASDIEVRYWREKMLRDPGWMEEVSDRACAWSAEMAEDIVPGGFMMSYGQGPDYTVAKMADTLFAAGPQVHTTALELGESNHALRLETITENDAVLLVAADGITKRHAELYTHLRASGRRALLVGAFRDGQSTYGLKRQPGVFEVPFMRRPIGSLPAAIAVQWLALAVAAKRVEQGYVRATDTADISAAALASQTSASHDAL